MRVIIVFFLIVFLSTNVLAADYLSDADEVVRVVRERLGIESWEELYLSDSIAHSLTRQGLVIVSVALGAEQYIDSFVTSRHQNVYSLGNRVGGIRSVIWSKNDSSKALIPVPMELWFQQDHKSTMGQKGFLKRPSYYAWDDNGIYLGPTPTNTDDDTIKVYGWRIRGDSIDYDTVTSLSSIPVKYRDAVVDYVVWRAALSRADPRSIEFERIWRESIGAKIPN